MTTLLVLTVGQSDVQLVVNGVRQELHKTRCAALHDELERRRESWRLVDSPDRKAGSAVEELPEGDLYLCTPKLDAVLRHDLAKNHKAPKAALILETRRDAEAERGDPRAAGAVLETRLKCNGVATVLRQTYLKGKERLEGSPPRDSVIRHEVVQQLDQAVRECFEMVTPARIVVATTGGFPSLAHLVDEIVSLHACGVALVELLEVHDGARRDPPSADRAVTRSAEPAASYQARCHALALIQKGNLLGAWGAVQHFHQDEVEHEWTQVVEWLARFASSLPMPESCDIPVLTHKRMAVRAALRVELALHAGDIPRAVHSTVAFFESALWDHLNERVEPHPEKKRLFKVNPPPAGSKLVRTDDGSGGDHKAPFEPVEDDEQGSWYKIHDDNVPAIRLAKYYLKREGLTKLAQAVSGDVRELRNDVAHNEPTLELMAEAQRRMTAASLWSKDGTFLKQPLVQEVLRELGEQHPVDLCAQLISTVRARLLEVRRTRLQGRRGDG